MKLNIPTLSNRADKRFSLWALPVLVLMFCVSGHSQAQSQAQPQGRHIEVVGVAEFSALPDELKVQVFVEHTAPTLDQARTQVDSDVAKVLAAVRPLDFEEIDINASRIQASPEYEWNNRSRQYLGEKVSRELQFTLRDVNRYSELMQLLMAAPIDRLGQIQFDFSNAKQLQEQAAVAASLDAQRQARALAKGLGASLGQVYAITPVNRGQHYGPRLAMEAKFDSAAAPLKVAGKTISAEVRVVYLLK